MGAADIAWVLTSTALVMLMTPALAFFYGGLVRTLASTEKKHTTLNRLRTQLQIAKVFEKTSPWKIVTLIPGKYFLS